MEEINLSNVLAKMIADHKVPLTKHKDYIELQGTDVLLQALGFPFYRPSGLDIQLDINLRSPSFLGKRTLTESFSEGGKNLDEAVQKAFFSFCIGSLHPILSVFVNRDLEADQVCWERWGKGAHLWDVCLGLVVPKISPSSDPNKAVIDVQDFAHFMHELREAYLHEASHDLHWLRIYRGSLHGKCAAREVLLDNANWSTGEAILDRSVWPAEPDFYSIRLFLIAVPVQPEKKWFKFW